MKKLILCLLLFTSANAALNETACAALVQAELAKTNPSAAKAYVAEYWTGICKGIIEHIKQAAVVSTTGTCAVSGGSSSGSHPTTATGSIQ